MIMKNNFTKSPTFIKILSFFMAFILWFFVAGDRQEEMLANQVRRTFSDIPINWRNLGEDLAVVEIEESITLSLQGAEQAFDGLTPVDLEAYVDLGGKREGYHELCINTVVPPRISVVRIKPGRAKVILEDLITKQMTVSYEVRGEPAGGFILETTTFGPRDVFVRGPRRKINLIEKVIFSVDISDVTKGFTQNAKLYTVDGKDNFIQGVEIVPEEVEVMFSLTYPQRELPVEPDFANGAAKVQEIEMEPSIVTVKGPKHILDNLTSIITEKIDLRGQPNDFTIEIPLSFPDEVQAINHKTVRVHVLLDQEP